MSVGLKTDKELQAMLVASDPRFTIAAYVGKHGWVSMKLDPEPDWREVEHFVVESYRMIAPKKLVKELEATRGSAGARPSSAKPPGARPPGAKASAAKKGAGVKRVAAKKAAGANAKRAAPAKRARTPRAG